MPDVRGGLLARRPTTLGAIEKAASLLSPYNWMYSGAKLVGEGLLGGADVLKRMMAGEEVGPAETLPLATMAMSGALGAPKGALGAGPVRRGGRIPKITDLPNLRQLPVEEAVAVAKSEPHLIPKKGGGFVGGPPGVKTKKDLRIVRKRFDKMIADDPRGGDWYDRYRAGTNEITGGDPRDATWVSQQQGMFSQGRDPGAEVQSSLKENIGSLMGMPEQAFYARQHQKHLAAVKANDPSLYTGSTPKLGEYARRVDPNRTFATATGTNDFRAANNFGYQVGTASGTSKTALSAAEHQFVDYEMALAVKRARDRELGGIKDWTGESVQAAPWVVDKTNSIVRHRNLIAKHMGRGLSRRDATKEAYDEAFAEANKTPADFFAKHTAFATHEAQPGERTGHHPGSLLATPGQRLEFGNDPRMAWGTAPGGRDAMYAGLRLGDTGVAGRVRPSQPATGMFEGVSNPVEVGRPLVAFAKGKPGVIDNASRAMLEGGETLRAAMDVQNVGAAHTVSKMGPKGQRRSLFIPLKRPLTEPEIYNLEATGKKHGLLGISDTGEGVTITNWGNEPAVRPGLLKDVTKALPDDALVLEPWRVKVDSIYADLSKQWRKGEGSGAVTRQVLKKVGVTKKAAAAFDNNPHLAQAALDRIAVSKDWTTKWGVGRKDVETFRRIIAGGPGWIGRLKTQLKEQPGTLPALAVGVFVGLNERER